MMRNILNLEEAKLESVGDFATTLETLMNNARKERSWIVEGLIEKGSLMLLVGPPKSYKSLFAQTLSIAVASGTNALDTFRVSRQRNVIYVQQESSGQALARRIDGLLAGLDMEQSSVGRRLTFVTNQGVLLDDSADVELIRRTIEEFEAEFIVFDSLAELHVADENSASEMARVMRPLKQIRDDYNVGILLVHHTNRHSSGVNAGKRIRGSSAIWAASDGSILVSPRKAYSLVTMGLREGAAAEPFRLTFSSGENLMRLKVQESGTSANQSEGKYRNLDQKIITFLKQYGPC